MKSIETSGKTVEDAIRSGLKELGCDLGDVTIDIIEKGSPGLFGMFGRLAKVRLTVKDTDPLLEIEMPHISLELPKEKPARKAENRNRREKPARETAVEEAPKPEKPKPEPQKPEPSKPEPKKPRPEAQPAPDRAEDERQIEPAEPAAEPETAGAAEGQPQREGRSRRRRRGGRSRAGAAPAAAEGAEETATEAEEVKPEPVETLPPTDFETLSDAGKRAHAFLTQVTEKMGVSVDIRAADREGGLMIQMYGDTLGVLIGRRGETLDALQYLTSLYVNRDKSDYVRVSLDTEHYRAKREESLRKLALRMANRVRKSGRRMALEPMNPYERRILHSALQNHPYVTTHSEGEEPYRRVIITLK